MTIGQQILELRRKHRLTQKELADKVQEQNLRCDFTYISKIENDKLDGPPSEELIRCIAKILETDPEEWLAMVGQFDRKALQNVVEDIPEVGVLLRKLQNREISAEQIRDWLESVDETPRN
ncbi:MAG: helix-turn-helix domain-containing protein [Deltaproteobacteria bacterium]|nr:helix-turn-helix domain-containing protein [Deltaproteobacteria bacterium]